MTTISYFASVGAIDEWRLGSFASVGAIGERQLGYLRALALSMSGGWPILRALAHYWRVAAPTAEAFAHCPPGSHDPARGPPLPAFRPVKIPVKKKGGLSFRYYSKRQVFVASWATPLERCSITTLSFPRRSATFSTPGLRGGAGKVATLPQVKSGD